MKNRYPEYIFFFGLFAIVSYVMWQIFTPFISTFALAVIIATVCYPLYARLLKIVPRNSPTGAALLSVLIIAVTIFVPLFIVGYMLFTEAVSFYETVNVGGSSGFSSQILVLEKMLGTLLPGYSIDVADIVRQGAGWVASHMGSIFAGTASTIFMLFMVLVSLFYLLRDGAEFAQKLIRLSPLQDVHDIYIIEKLATAIRSVVLGTLVVALIQGVLTSIGFTIFGINQAVLWGSVAAIGALIPGVGTSLVFIVVVAFSVFNGAYLTAGLLTAWGVFAVGLIDNFLGPYLMSRGAALHPFAVLVSVLGGIGVFGPAGFLIGPVILSFFIVLLELYTTHMRDTEKHAR